MNEKPVTVALLDEHLIVREAIWNSLGGYGVQVVAHAGSADEFFAAVSQSLPRVALMEVVLANGDGFELLRALRRDFPDVQILVFSGSRDPGIVQRCLEAGAAGFIEKRTAGSQIVAQAIRDIANGQRIVPMESFTVRSDPERFQIPDAGRLRQLTAREHQVLRYVASGDDPLKIAAMLGISERTVKAHLSTLYRKLTVDNRTQLALLAVRLGVQPAESRGA